MRTVIRSSRRRFRTFCDFRLVSNQIWPSRTPYHMATTCGAPVGPMVAMVAVRLRRMNSATSSSVILICARWLIPMLVPSVSPPGGGAGPGGSGSSRWRGARSRPATAGRAGAGGASALAVGVLVLVGRLGQQPAGRGERGGQPGGLVDHLGDGDLGGAGHGRGRVAQRPQQRRRVLRGRDGLDLGQRRHRPPQVDPPLLGLGGLAAPARPGGLAGLLLLLLLLVLGVHGWSSGRGRPGARLTSRCPRSAGRRAGCR